MGTGFCAELGVVMGCRSSKQKDEDKEAKREEQLKQSRPRQAQKTRTWESTFQSGEGSARKVPGKKRPMVPVSGTTKMVVGPVNWEITRESVQVDEKGGTGKYEVREIYEGVVEDVEMRQDALVYTLRANNIVYNAGGKYDLKVQVTYEEDAEPKAKDKSRIDKYEVNQLDECKAGPQVMQWHLSLDNDEVWSQDRAGETTAFRSICVMEDKDAQKEVWFFPDDKGHWSDMELTKTKG